MKTELTYQIFRRRRKTLGKILSIKMPFMTQIQVINLCNFKCFYCLASQPLGERKKEGNGHEL